MTHQVDSAYLFLLPVWCAIGGVLLLALAILVWALMRHSRRNRELLHTERMRALELGQPASFSEPDKLQEKYAHNAFWIAFWVGAGVPMVAAGAAAQVMTQANVHELGLTLAIWGGAAVISIASIICATVLMVSARHMPISVERTGPRSSVGGAAP